MAKDGLAYNFIAFRPRKTAINLELKLPRSEETDKLIDDAGIETLDYRWGRYRLTLHKDDIAKKREALTQLIGAAYKNRAG